MSAWVRELETAAWHGAVGVVLVAVVWLLFVLAAGLDDRPASIPSTVAPERVHQP